jgi:nitrite reductase/ring-hydroxylating ferredoxin subunit
MESFNPKPEDSALPASPSTRQRIVAGRVEDLPPGRSLTVALADGNELAVYNVDGEFFATENSCPHHGAPLADGRLCGHVIECGWHGWQFDVRDGRCLLVSESIATYRVLVEDGLIKIEV